MGIPKSELGTDDVYVKYDHEDVMFRYDGSSRKFYRKFVGESEETEVPHDSDLLNDSLRFGEAIEAGEYGA